MAQRHLNCKNKNEYIKNFRTLMAITAERTEEINKEAYNKYLPLIKTLKTDIEEIHVNFLTTFADSQKITSLLPDTKYNFKYTEVVSLLRDFIYHIYEEDNGEYRLLSIDEQNKKLRTYPHFDISMKKPKSLKCL